MLRARPPGAAARAAVTYSWAVRAPRGQLGVVWCYQVRQTVVSSSEMVF